MAVEKDVLEFIIVPPYERRHEVLAAKERIEAYLSNRFPGYTFKVPQFAPVGGDDDFMVIPMMNFLGDDGHSYMCNEPKSWFMAEIAAACREFDAKGRRSFAA